MRGTVDAPRTRPSWREAVAGSPSLPGLPRVVASAQHVGGWEQHGVLALELCGLAAPRAQPGAQQFAREVLLIQPSESRRAAQHFPPALSERRRPRRVKSCNWCYSRPTEPPSLPRPSPWPRYALSPPSPSPSPHRLTRATLARPRGCARRGWFAPSPCCAFVLRLAHSRVGRCVSVS